MGPRAIGADAIRPYELDDTVDVIGHDDKFVQYDMGTDTFCFAPFFICDNPRFIELHLTINNVSKQWHPIMRADGNKIQSGL